MIHVAGGVVWNPLLGVVVVRQLHDTWSLPKGHIEEGEDELAAAIREIHEESGISPSALELIRLVGTYERGRTPLVPGEITPPRQLTIYFFRTDATVLAPIDPDNPEARWVPPENVAEILTNPKDKEFFEEFRKHAPEFTEQ